MDVCLGGSGGAAHSSRRYVAAAVEAERPEREGAAAGSGKEILHYVFVFTLAEFIQLNLTVQHLPKGCLLSVLWNITAIKQSKKMFFITC